MIKADLHIHTSAANYERSFEFCLENLRSYVAEMNLDLIAITNHNHFERKQFDDIKKELDCTVLPGVEVDLEGGHILVIAPIDSISEIDCGCKILGEKIVDETSFITFSEFEEIFPNYKNYILIPHLDKKPPIKESTLNKFSSVINSGEVKSAKKFETLKKSNDEYAPLLFSDLRISTEFTTDKINNRATFIDINTTDFSNLKLAVGDKSKLFLTENKKSGLFSFLKDGSEASTKLNVIIGARSTGKTFTLNEVYKTGEQGDNNIKYIKQFSLTGKSEEESFKRIIGADSEEVINSYIHPFRALVDRIVEVDEIDDSIIDEYLASVKTYAKEREKEDAFSKCLLFTETTYDSRDSQELVNLIKSQDSILSNKSYKTLIDEYINRNLFIELLQKLTDKRKKELLNHRLKCETDSIVNQVKLLLESKSSLNAPKVIDFQSYYRNMKIIENFDRIVKKLQVSEEIYCSDIQRFKIKVTRKNYKNATELKNELKVKTSLTSEFKNYEGSAFRYVNSLQEAGIKNSIIYKTFFKFDSIVMNERGYELSGGERAEYNLIREIEKASEYDILLIDEPEASFDNKFLNENIIKIIKQLSQKTTVFLSTHNNTLGSLIKPEVLIYTDFSNEEYKVYVGEFGATNLNSKTGDYVDSYSVLMDSLEAGSNAYEERRNIYETIKN